MTITLPLLHYQHRYCHHDYNAITIVLSTTNTTTVSVYKTNTLPTTTNSTTTPTTPTKIRILKELILELLYQYKHINTTTIY